MERIDERIGELRTLFSERMQADDAAAAAARGAEEEKQSEAMASLTAAVGAATAAAAAATDEAAAASSAAAAAAAAVRGDITAVGSVLSRTIYLFCSLHTFSFIYSLFCFFT